MRSFDDWDNWVNNIINDMMDGRVTGGLKRSTSHNYYSSNDEVMEDDDYIYIDTQLQGTPEEDFEIIPKEEVVILYKIPTNDRIIWNLPCKVQPSSIEYTYNNFVLDIKLKKLKESKDE